MHIPITIYLKIADASSYYPKDLQVYTFTTQWHETANNADYGIFLWGLLRRDAVGAFNAILYRTYAKLKKQ